MKLKLLFTILLFSILSTLGYLIFNSFIIIIVLIAIPVFIIFASINDTPELTLDIVIPLSINIFFYGILFSGALFCLYLQTEFKQDYHDFLIKNNILKEYINE